MQCIAVNLFTAAMYPCQIDRLYAKPLFTVLHCTGKLQVGLARSWELSLLKLKDPASKAFIWSYAIMNTTTELILVLKTNFA